MSKNKQNKHNKEAHKVTHKEMPKKAAKTKPNKMASKPNIKSSDIKKSDSRSDAKHDVKHPAKAAAQHKHSAAKPNVHAKSGTFNKPVAPAHKGSAAKTHPAKDKVTTGGKPFSPAKGGVANAKPGFVKGNFDKAQDKKSMPIKGALDKNATNKHVAHKNAAGKPQVGKAAAAEAEELLKKKNAKSTVHESAKKIDAKKSIGSNPPKKQKKKDEFEDEILETDEEMGGEEIPDLSEFDEDMEIEGEEPEAEEEVVIASVTMDVATNKPKADEEVVLTDAEGRRYCRVRECDQAAMVEGYCRFHYLALWKKIQIRRKILIDGKLERYVEELTSRYPDKFLEVIRKDLRSEKDFIAAIAELEIDDSGAENELEDETQSFIDEVRGMSEAGISEDEEY